MDRRLHRRTWRPARHHRYRLWPSPSARYARRGPSFPQPATARTCRRGSAISAGTEGDDRHADIVERSVEHTSEPQSLKRISYDVLSVKNKNTHVDLLTEHMTI